MKPVKVVVDRQTWDRGGGDDNDVFLLHKQNGMMCCVGFVCLKLGWSPEQIRGIATIAELQPEEGQEFPDTWLGRNSADRYNETSDFYRLYTINDNPKIDDDNREDELIKQAALVGIEFEFVN